MSIHAALMRLKEAAQDNPPAKTQLGLGSQRRVEVRDLRELLRDYDRLDAIVRKQAEPPGPRPAVLR